MDGMWDITEDLMYFFGNLFLLLIFGIAAAAMFVGVVYAMAVMTEKIESKILPWKKNRDG